MLTEPEIKLLKVKDINLAGGILVDGFPSVGLANAIASECMVHSQKAELAGVMDSPAFPALSIVRSAMPHFPTRLYVNLELKLAMFVSELNLDPTLFRPVALAMLQWAEESGCSLVISAAGIPQDDDSEVDSQVYAVGSTPRVLKRAAEAGIPPMISGTITGIPAILLNEAFVKNLDVMVLLVGVRKDAPDFRAAAAIAVALSKLVPGALCDVESLIHEAEIIEDSMKKARKDQTASPVREMYG